MPTPSDIQTLAANGPIGGGSTRAVAFGGGGEWFIAWMVGYASGLHGEGIDLAAADVTVGTSAGALVGAAVKGGRIAEFTEALHQLAADPAAANDRLHITLGAASQARARAVMGSATDVTPASLQEIGRAAMAARNAPATAYVAAVDGLLGLDAWPGGHHVTATDCYTGESLIIGAQSGVTIAQAAAASSSLPGVNGPTWLGDRLCMDGGVSPSSTHAEALDGARAVVIIGMFDFSTSRPDHVNPAFGIAERLHPGTARREAAALSATGSTVHVVIANPDPRTDFMDPSTIGPAMAQGAARGAADAAALSEIW